ncbi:MAG: formyltransferase family protein [Thermoleophilia bacterium]
MSRGLDLLAGGTLGAWAVRHASPALVRQVVCLDDALIAVAAERGHHVFAGDPHAETFGAAGAALSVHFPLILRPALIDRYRGAIWNLHPGLLPYGRGMYPVFWALWERTPAGATLHELTAGLDAGPIVEQREVPVLSSDTGGRLHERVQAAERELFLRWLPRLAAGERPASRPQPPGGSQHTLAEFEFMRDEGRYEVPRAERERLRRCLTFPPARVPASRR